ncbi:YcbK family protein [Roseovarius sp. D0-M9]|uniref:YcbK family protein n=1 Tax=Roseovarius sp. D0-M9 TaxID=3127117 RepID=UPI00300F8C6F
MSKQMIKLSHWSEATDWPYAHFTPAELASKGNGSLKLEVDAIERLERLRVKLDAPMLVTSAYRDPAHNRSVGGAKGSYHMRGQAFDIRMDNHDPAEFEEAAREVGFTGFGYYPHLGFMHIDTGPARSWGKKFPLRETRFAPEPEPARKTQAAKEGTSVAAIAVAAERVVNEAAPVLPDYLVTYGFTALAVLGLGIVLWRMLRTRAE